MHGSDEEFIKAYRTLNDAQRRAVDAIEGPVMVIAGPGTGKTTVLTLRIAHILRTTDTPPSGILAITYTEAGVAAMRQKLHRLIGSVAYQVHIHTFHGFAAAMIAEYPDHFLHLSDARTMTDIEQEALVRNLLLDERMRQLRPIGRPDAYLRDIVRAISDAKRDAYTPDDLRTHAENEIERIRQDESSISTRGANKGSLKASAEAYLKKCERTRLLADIYQAYEESTRSRNLMDFDDLILELLNALTHDRLLLQLVQERFLYILVDEHQDTNTAQNNIIQHIAAFFEDPNLFIVGDEKQAIYRFQGASVENFLALTARWPSMQRIALTQNYRSSQPLLDAVFAMIEHNYEANEHAHLRTPLLAVDADTSRPVSVIRAQNTAAMEASLVASLRECLAQAERTTAAVIVRRNKDVERVLSVLEMEGISASSERSVDIFNHPLGELFFDLLTYLNDPSRTDALARTMMYGGWSLSVEDTAEYIRLVRAGHMREVEQRFPALVHVRNMLSQDAPIRFLIHAGEVSGCVERAGRDPVAASVWRGIVTLAESIVRTQNITSPHALIESLLAYRQSAQMKTVKVAIGAPESAITVLTAHASKGLEFDYVYLPYATEESWIGRPRGSSFVLPALNASMTHDVRDIRRLFYVALTRARTHAEILTAEEETDGSPLTPLRFIEELDEQWTAVTNIPRFDALPRMHTSFTLHTARADALTNLAKRRLLSDGLSVTALNHFITDPIQFLHKSVLRLPEAPSMSAEKGNAMHAAIDCVWRSAHHGSAALIEKTIRNAVSDYLSRSLLPAPERESVRMELLEHAPHVAASLQAHFAVEGPIYTERRIETSWNTVIHDEPVSIMLHGKLDAIVERDNRVFVFDYKTRRSMSEAAIRGETKHTDGSYFRQLVFYTYLLSRDARWKHRPIEAALVFLTPERSGRCAIKTIPVTPEDQQRLSDEIQQLVTYVWNGQLGRDSVDQMP